MTPSETEIEELEKLEREADDLLAKISRSTTAVSSETLDRLEIIAGAAAKIAYGTGSAKLLSDQMSTLITWTDHLDDVEWTSRFQKALSTRPLIHPWR
jgi:hypothetical protein